MSQNYVFKEKEIKQECLNILLSSIYVHEIERTVKYMYFMLGGVAQLVWRLTQEPEVPATNLRFSFR